MTKPTISLQDLRRRIYTKAKSEPEWRFWGLYIHVCKMETLETAYRMARKKNGAPGVDGVTFEMIEERGVSEFLEEIQLELVDSTYRPLPNRKKEIPKGGGKVRVLGIPSIRDRVVQGALKLILEPIFEADFQDGSYGYRPTRTPHQALDRVDAAILKGKTVVIDLDLKGYFDNVRHHILLEKVAKRVDDDRVMHLLKLMLKAGGKKGVPQGGVISPLLANLYLNEVDRMLERAKEVTRKGEYTRLEYVRYADDLVVLIDGYARHRWLIEPVQKRLGEELGKLEVEVNKEKTKTVDLTRGESFGFLGFEYRRIRSGSGKWRSNKTPKLGKRTELLGRLRGIFEAYVSQPVRDLVAELNPVLRGWVNYFRVGNSGQSLGYVRDWIARKLRRHLMRASKRRGVGWKRWSWTEMREELGIYSDFRVRYYRPARAPAR